MATAPPPSGGGNPLGEPADVFKPMLSNTIAGFILCLLVGAGGVAALGAAVRLVVEHGGNLPLSEGEDSWMKVGLISVIAAGALLLSTTFGWLSWRMLAARVEVRPLGFRFVAREGATDVRWEDVARVRQTVQYERLPIVKGPAKLLMPKIANTSFDVLTKSGRVFQFHENSVKAIKRFGRVLKEHTDRDDVPWEAREIG